MASCSIQPPMLCLHLLHQKIWWKGDRQRHLWIKIQNIYVLRNFELARLSLFRFTFLGQDNTESSGTSCNVEHADGWGKVKGRKKNDILGLLTISTFTVAKHLHRLATGRITDQCFEVNNCILWNPISILKTTKQKQIHNGFNNCSARNRFLKAFYWKAIHFMWAC